MAIDRFAYDQNLQRATRYREWRSAFWPPSDEYRLICLDLAPEVPSLGPGLAAELETLRTAIDVAWQKSKTQVVNGPARMHDAASVTRCLHRIAKLLPNATDRRALELRAGAVERGYEDGTLSALAGLDEDITFIAGNISTWYGKQTRGLPTAFGCVRDEERQAAVAKASEHMADVAAYVRSLHTHLRLGEVPAFSATRLFFMAGEGNRHPKHIAYFLPEDEGVKHSPFKKTYHFTNTHHALLNTISLPLARRLLHLGTPIPSSSAALGHIPTLGVLAHEFGHFVHREGVTFAALNSAARWASVTLQEAAADVFGTLVLAEVLAPALGIPPADVVTYHLAECLRYVDRGLGCFPDSDGMYLQLAYLVSFGALTLEPGAESRLVGDPEVVIAAFRSLARVFADTLLAGDVERSIALHQAYGPATPHHLDQLIATLREGPPKTLEYKQEPRVTEAQNHAAVFDVSARPQPAATSTQESPRGVSIMEGFHDFYCRPKSTAADGPARTIYQIWEKGEAFNDSVTPSTYCPEYRTHMELKILSLSKQRDQVFSIGCGNAFVEAGLLAKGLNVHAIDCNDEAVELAVSKGVNAIKADFAALPPGHLSTFSTVYADGLLGHLYRPGTELEGFFDTLMALNPRPGSWLVLSNDAPSKSGARVVPHERLRDFWLLSKEYLSEVLERRGFTVWESYHFPYYRPVSGLRNRTICVARLPGSETAEE
ncbi:class I SAM-dependent methyltransferase [Archangium lansingense]|uniref:Methyltransferase domain-containing protein n=1 Tax=Archangium lansingense TaxID=2995310 RepID=A0ABT4AEU6_9BACT|nr:hypothetical protein [Archangium lansinium]MCY1079434.1 hypothetical protein [Archangium lansinium]